MRANMRIHAKLTIAALFALALTLTPSPAVAERLSRAQAVYRAMQQNPQILAAYARRAQAEAEKAQADAARWPQITVELGVGPSLRAELVPGTAVGSTKSRYDVTLDDLSVVFGGRVSVLQPLYTFGKIDSLRRAAAHAIRAREAQVQMTRADLALEVARLYEGLLFARDALRFFEEIENYVGRTLAATEERLSSNVAGVSEQDALRLQTARAAARLALHQARAAQAQASAGLIAYLSLPVDGRIDPAEDRLAPIPGTSAVTRTLIANALRHRPELVALEQGAQAYDSLARSEQAGYLPDLFALAFATGAYTPGRDRVDSRYVVDPLYHFDPGLLVGLRWQVQADMASGRADQRRAQAQELRHLKSWALSGMPAQVTKAHEDIQRARRDLDEARTAVGRAKQWVVRASADYVVGLTDSQSVVDSTRAYAELRTAELDAIYRHNIGRAELAHASGALGSGAGELYPGRTER
jgi:outer membrane protein TolC